MTDDALYQQQILTLARRQTGAGLLDSPDARATVDNPVCGDRITLDIALDGPHIAAVGHKVRGCLLCEAAASLIGAQAVGRATADLRRWPTDAAALLTEAAPAPADCPDMAVFSPVAAVRSRHRCVLLPFEALLEVISKTE